ncbi:hypothetical protein MXB_5072 [Myxobolus squamalis]|nr:hypothetical protein MXB_5072 [Myxobolus squamalis]
MDLDLLDQKEETFCIWLSSLNKIIHLKDEINSILRSVYLDVAKMRITKKFIVEEIIPKIPKVYCSILKEGDFEKICYPVENKTTEKCNPDDSLPIKRKKNRLNSYTNLMKQESSLLENPESLIASKITHILTIIIDLANEQNKFDFYYNKYISFQ